MKIVVMVVDVLYWIIFPTQRRSAIHSALRDRDVEVVVGSDCCLASDVGIEFVHSMV